MQDHQRSHRRQYKMRSEENKTGKPNVVYWFEK